MNKKLILIIASIIIMTSFILNMLSKIKNGDLNTDDTLLEKAKYYAGIIYFVSHDLTYNRDYLKNILERNAAIDNKMIFLEYLAYFMNYSDRWLSLILKKEYRRIIFFAVFNNISDYIKEVTKDPNVDYHFTNFYNQRVNEYSKYDFLHKKDARVFFDENKLPKFINMNNYLAYEFTKRIIGLLSESMDSLLAFEIFNSVITTEETIAQEVMNGFKSDKLKKYIITRK